MLIQNSSPMATDDYAVMAVVVGFAIIVGFIFGRISQKADYNKRIDQKIGLGELERWKLRPKYANILMEKKPEVAAQKELDKLMEKNAENRLEQEEINKKIEQLIEEMTALRKKAESQKSDVEGALLLDTLVSNWFSKVTEVRGDAEQCNDVNISFGYQKRFLKFVINGSRKPTIVGQMDKVATDVEIENPHKKNFEMMDSMLGSLQHVTIDKLKEGLNINY
ncbi:MAG: hypothetical protein CL961_06805 [Euryarchaeota archaeon]|nr:hypothetical protein [Euryarchaeota archaeon]